jgi:hypothetical protein
VRCSNYIFCKAREEKGDGVRDLPAALQWLPNRARDGLKYKKMN